MRERVFTRDLFGCQMPACGKVISNRRQLVCDHVRPHRGDPALFWDEGNLQTLCKPCHDGAKQSAERRAR
ncbi:HNH endonuclease signature motif containing protein [Xanthobacter flavus]|uniref:HNH endonuclease n=1 Tax=Xanthobacter flavus TaxID=281 RepID=UPI00372AD6D5